MSAAMAYSFGPYRLDPGSSRLSRDGEPVLLSERYVAVLLQLVTHSGTVVPKETLLDAGWKDVAVGDNSIEQAISTLRRTLGAAPDGGAYIETLARRGYRFRAAVASLPARTDDATLDALLAPHRAFTEGRTALETFDRDAIAQAQQVFERIVADAPEYGPAHVGLANACSFRFESTRADEQPDREALAKALVHAREGCRLNPSSGEAWATLGGILAQAHLTGDAIAAARRSISLEDENWRHHLRFAYVSWGEERLRSARRALKLVPGFAFGHWLAATVHVARGALPDAERELEAGAVSQDGQHRSSRFASSGLHFLLGLVRLARGDDAAAEPEFERELSNEHATQIYTRQVCAHTHCALGALHLRRGDRAAAQATFDRAQAAVAAYPLALVAASAVRALSDPTTGDLRATLDRPGPVGHRLDRLRAQGGAVEAAMVEAVADALSGRHAEAAARVYAALDAAPPGSDGWMLPVDPFLEVGAHLAEWSPVLALLRDRSA